MVRALRVHASADAAGRLLAPLLVAMLVVTLNGVGASPVEAGSSGSNIAGIRHRQLKAEATMLRADKQIKRLQAQRKHGKARFAKAKRKLDRLIFRRDRVRARADRADARLGRQQQILARALRVHPNPSGVQISDKPKLRKKVRKLDARVGRLQREARQLVRKVEKARHRKQRNARGVTRARIGARKAARERAEDKLGIRISQMLSLSKDRAATRLAGATQRGFAKPSKGHISQRYGCTGYAANSSHGSCRHFHDGIDIAAPRGTRVRASADGFVAYVGRNPWDTGRRAFVVIVGHANGYETVYAHLQPIRKVRAGQVIKRGQVLGVVGLTGHTSGPHVHWEVKRHSRTVNPSRAGR